MINKLGKIRMRFREGLTEVPIEGLVSSVATKGGMGGGTAAALYGWLTSSNAAVLIGILVTVAGFVVNWIYQRKRDKREEREQLVREQLDFALHQARLLQIRHNCEVPSEQQREVA